MCSAACLFSFGQDEETEVGEEGELKSGASEQKDDIGTLEAMQEDGSETGSGLDTKNND
jgi:hypothetical protein